MMEMTIQAIRQTGSEVAKPETQYIDPEAFAAVPVGAFFARQGDIYLKKLNAIPAGADKVEPFVQLAPGETLGSRHCLDSLEGVEMYLLRSPAPLDGPIIATYREKAILHPVHGDICAIPAGAVIQVTYQRAFADRIKRVTD